MYLQDGSLGLVSFHNQPPPLPPPPNRCLVLLPFLLFLVTFYILNQEFAYNLKLDDIIIY